MKTVLCYISENTLVDTLILQKGKPQSYSSVEVLETHEVLNGSYNDVSLSLELHAGDS